jgi:intraflagellar transport protein 52
MMNLPTRSLIIRVKLAHLTNKCTNDDLDFWISEAGNIMGLKDKVNTNNPKEVLLFVMNSIIKFKMSMQ